MIHFSTAFCETQWRHSVKTRFYMNPPPYFIVLASSVKTKEVEVIEFHRIGKPTAVKTVLVNPGLLEDIFLQHFSDEVGAGMGVVRVQTVWKQVTSHSWCGLGTYDTELIKARINASHIWCTTILSDESILSVYCMAVCSNNWAWYTISYRPWSRVVLKGWIATDSYNVQRCHPKS